MALVRAPRLPQTAGVGTILTLVDADEVDAASRQAGDELAACLERFLAATADEWTLSRAREAIAVWQGLSELRA